VRVGIDSYTYHRLLGELRPGEDDPGERLPDGGAAVVAEARALGVEAVSLETCYLDAPSVLDVAALHEAADGIELALSWGAPNGLEFGRSAAALDDLLDWISFAPRLGCRLMRVVAAGPRLRRHADEWPNAVQPLRRAAALADAEGLELALENHGDLTAGQMEALLEAVDEPALGVCFDTANALRVGDDVLEAARLLVPAVRMVHLKDCEPVEGADPLVGPRSVPFGEGAVPLREVLEALPPHALVCVELGHLGSGPVDERELVRQAVDWLRKLDAPAEASAGPAAGRR
jgi:sugar phosphate isomerase/epimerase